MKRHILVLAALAALVAAPATLAEADPAASVKADIAKLLDDAKAQHDLVVVEAGDRPVQPASRDDAVATLEGDEHLLALALLLLLRADQEEPEDREDRGEEQELREDGGGPASARRGRGREGEVTGVSGAKHPRMILHNARKTEP